MRIYVGNIPFHASEQDFRDFFAPTELSKITIITDRETGQPRGFAFVDVADAREGKAAIERLHQADFGGRRATVNEALDKPRSGGAGRPAGDSGGRNGKGGRGGGGGGKNHRGGEDRGRRRRDDY